MGRSSSDQWRGKKRLRRPKQRFWSAIGAGEDPRAFEKHEKMLAVEFAEAYFAQGARMADQARLPVVENIAHGRRDVG
jgi:hypothetical protein